MKTPEQWLNHLLSSQSHLEPWLCVVTDEVKDIISQAMQQAREQALEEAVNVCMTSFQTKQIGNGACLSCANDILALKTQRKA